VSTNLYNDEGYVVDMPIDNTLEDRVQELIVRFLQDGPSFLMFYRTMNGGTEALELFSLTSISSITISLAVHSDTHYILLLIANVRCLNSLEGVA
jgi:hypothetical protein